jgi:2-dehydro-3-deoxygalactonokinase
MTDFIGINWGSSNFRAYRISPDGTLVDSFAAPAGIATLDRAGMARQIVALVARWPDCGPIYASGMVGSNVGWVEVPYANCPAGLAAVKAAAVTVDVGAVAVTIVPGMTCRHESDGGTDILRGEETEIFGLAALEGLSDGMVGLPGTHTKWARIGQGKVRDFATSMSGEIFDRLTTQGLLASIVEGEAKDGDAFRAAVAQAYARPLGLGTALFGVRAQVIRGELARSDAASTLRGLLIGTDIADALALFPGGFAGSVPLVGNASLCALYAVALAMRGIDSHVFDADRAAVAGFSAIHAA